MCAFATVATLSLALQMRVLSRTDYLIYDQGPRLAFAAKLNISGLEDASVAVSTESLFLTMSQKSPGNTSELI